MSPVIEAVDLSVSFAVAGRRRESRQVRAVRSVSLAVQPGEAYGLVGESGSGKSTMGRALLRLVDASAGSVLLGGVDITRLRERRLRPFRRDMQMVFQDPYSSLDPAAVIGDSIAEPLIAHSSLDRAGRAARVGELLEAVGLPAASAERYPYEFSGGQRQRIAVARALATEPRLMVLDEAVSALDVSTQNQVLELLQRLRADLGVAYLFISHNLGVVRWIADRVGVMYLGRIVEEGPASDVYAAPAHPYTQALLASVPVPDPATQRHRPPALLVGDPPDPLRPPPGCAFHARCPHAIAVCATEPPPRVDLAADRWVSCHLATPTPHDAVPKLMSERPVGNVTSAG